MIGSNQPGKASEAAVKQPARQVQVAVTEALRMLETISASDSASWQEVDHLRRVVCSDLTRLGVEFGRQDGPRAELVDRFFSHLLSSGDYIGQIESLAEALLGGEPPPTQPPPDSPVAGLFRLHGTLTTIRQQWQEAILPRASRPAAAASAAAPPPRREPPPPPAREPPKPVEDDFFDEMVPPPPEEETEPDPAPRGRAATERPGAQPPRRHGSDRFLADLGIGGSSAPGRAPDPDAPIRPRVILSFVGVFVILALVGVGIIYFGLSSASQSSAGPEPSVVPTFSVPLPTTTATPPTPVLSSAPPQLQVTGLSLIVPCPDRGNSGFVLRNAGGQILRWSAKVNTVTGSAQPVALDPAFGSLYGPSASATDVVSVKVTANVGNIDGKITISTNIAGPAGTVQISYHVHGC